VNQTLINRPHYLSQLIGHKDVDLVKIITGIRRCGKSSLLELFKGHLITEGIPEDNIISMNLQSLKFENLGNYRDFYQHVAASIPAEGRTYLLFDEIQSVAGFEKAIESLRLEYDVDIYITGSNAHLLSTELSTLLSGRYVEIKMLPLSFAEFLTFNEFDDALSVRQKFRLYFRFGGMPILKQYAFDEKRSYEALDGVYSSIVLRDILDRDQSARADILRKVIRFLASNIGSITSPNSIGGVLSDEKDIDNAGGMAGKTVAKYIDLLEKAYIFQSLERYDIKGKQHLRTLGKHYITDLGFRHMLLGFRDIDRGHLLENLVFLELRRQDYSVYLGKVGSYEIDFVAEKPNERIYIQVTESMNSKEVREREIRPLLSISDNYEKLILSMDEPLVESYEGIKVRNLIEWLQESKI